MYISLLCRERALGLFEYMPWNTQIDDDISYATQCLLCVQTADNVAAVFVTTIITEATRAAAAKN